MRDDFRRLCAVALIAAGLSIPAEAAEVTGVRIGESDGRTRLVLETSARVDAVVSRIAAPDRVVIDLPALRWRVDPSKIGPRGPIAKLRHGRQRGGGSRLVLDLAAPVGTVRTFVLPSQANRGYRLVVDLRAQTEGGLARRSSPAAGQPRAGPASPVPRPKPQRRKPLIVLDPGHGGVDPGAIGVGGTREKRVTLAHAQVLARRLKATGHYRVLLTRRNDRFIRLGRRVRIARESKADLFISLHADSHRKRAISGASVYTLSERASDRAAAALAARENKADLIAGVALDRQSSEIADILIDLSQRQTMNESAVFARILMGRLGKVRRLLRNTHRFAGFAVLKAPDVPSVLVELGYLSNRRDEKRLLSSAHRVRVADAIISAIDAYFARRRALRG